MFGFSTLADDPEEETNVTGLASEGRGMSGSGDGDGGGGEQCAGQDDDDGDHSSSDDDIFAPVSESGRCPRYLENQRLYLQPACPFLGLLARERPVVLLRRRGPKVVIRTKHCASFDPTGSELNVLMLWLRAPPRNVGNARMDIKAWWTISPFGLLLCSSRQMTHHEKQMATYVVNA